MTDLQLTQAQKEMAAQLQRGLRQLPMDVIINHLKVAMQERKDFDHAKARDLSRMAGALEWEFY